MNRLRPAADRHPLRIAAVVFCLISLPAIGFGQEAASLLKWKEMEQSLPDELGVAGPFAGVHNDALIVAGGANFPKPVWETNKHWRDKVYVLWTKPGQPLQWKECDPLPQPLAYGAAVSTKEGVLCMGGSKADPTVPDSEEVFADVFLLQWDRKTQTCLRTKYPSLPEPIAYGYAALIGETIYLACGQTTRQLGSATNRVWSYDMTSGADGEWKMVKSLPGPTRAFNMTVHQHNGYNDALYVLSGRRQNGEEVEFLKDVWEYTPATDSWRQRKDLPTSMMAGTAIDYGQSHIFVLSGADGSFWGRANELKDDHPGFPKKSYAYHTITDTWIDAGETPANHVTTIAVKWGESIVVPSGEIRPRVRSPKLWRVTPNKSQRDFGTVNYIVLFGYLAAMVGVGLYFAKKNTNTDAFFRGGKSIPWWAAGCSIFATMLSSLTYTGVPAKAYAQDWVYAVGNAMIPLVAILAVFVALPFFRRIDATSAYEYLEKRFSRPVRWFGSLSFTIFHIFRMAVVMSLTGLALSVATPLTPTQSVQLMGLLSIVYCATGGIEAVIWTDTIQTVVLLGGAIVAFVLLMGGVDGGFSGFVSTATESNKFNIANLHWDATDKQIALWVIIAGGIAQNISSYTADQAVVQRYMTTSDEKLAARSIWTNALLTIPATLLFFGMGTALFAFYQTNPDKLDPAITTDQVFPLFIAREMPVGLAGLMVAGIFAAAQSTVSTSMNSTATTIVTDFLRPLSVFNSDRAYLNAGRVFTVIIGVLGTLLGLMFVSPEIKSLFDEFIKVIGLFMGVLGGLFVLGALTTRATGTGALIGAIVGAAVMFCLWKFTAINGYLYTAAGITTCFVVGYITSFGSAQSKDLTGLTVYSMSADVGL
ncbi:MAG: sodium/solute symporter [Planctomycetaceae bacterium]